MCSEKRNCINDYEKIVNNLNGYNFVQKEDHVTVGLILKRNVSSFHWEFVSSFRLFFCFCFLFLTVDKYITGRKMIPFFFFFEIVEIQTHQRKKKLTDDNGQIRLDFCAWKSSGSLHDPFLGSYTSLICR